jgi:hypothetical protein
VTAAKSSAFRLMSARHAQALGYLVAYWSEMDATLNFFISLLVGLEGDASFVTTAELSSLQRFAMIRALLFETREQSWVDRWESLASRFEELRTARNNAVHAVWLFDQGRYQAFRVTAKGKVSKRSLEIPTAQLNQITEAVINLYGEVDHFAIEVGSEASRILRNPPTKPRLISRQGRGAQSLIQAREAKKARKQASREHPTNRPRNPSSDA